MLKPIVSMNQMAMNESIATTCCYVWNGTSILGSASLPHGGQLVAKTDTKSYVKIDNAYYPLNSTWWGYTAGHAAQPDTASQVITTSSDETATGGIHDWVVKNATGNFWKLDDLLGTQWVTKSVGGYCDHVNNPNCPYFKETKYTGTFKHTGATSAHYTWTSGNTWLADHPAVQFSS